MATSSTTAPGASVAMASKAASATVDGAGALEAEADGLHVRYSAVNPYLGDTRVTAASVKLASVEPTLKVLPGDALTVTRDDFEVMSVSNAMDAGRAAQGAAALALAPRTVVRVAGLSADVKRLRVDGAGGTLVLSAPRLTSSNFVFRSALFNVPKAGTYTFGVLLLNGLPQADGTYLQVGVTASDVELFIDQISVKKAAEDVLPELPEKLELDLAKDVKVRLDYAGTLEVDTLRINGAPVVGLIDASHPSGLVVGTGRLYVRPKGTVLIFR